MEAFSDGVIAIIITIMVLEIKVPHGEQWADLSKLWPVFLSYVLSFLYVGIYWNNHHHLMHTVQKVNGKILMANLNLLFWMSLLPFTTGWMGENHFATNPMMLYAVNLLMCALSWVVLQTQIIKLHGNESVLAMAVGTDLKGKISTITYVLAISGLALFNWTVTAGVLLVAVALMWFIPDRRIEKILQSEEEK